MNKVKSIILPVVEEAGKFVDTAKDQITLSDGGKENESTKKLVEDIYKPGEKKSLDEIIQNKSMEKTKLEETRQKLYRHQEYYQSTFNKPKQQEERPAEKVEREKIQDLQREEKKKKPVLVQRAQQKTEKYPGASG